MYPGPYSQKVNLLHTIVRKKILNWIKMPNSIAARLTVLKPVYVNSELSTEYPPSPLVPAVWSLTVGRSCWHGVDDLVWAWCLVFRAVLSGHLSWSRPLLMYILLLRRLAIVRSECFFSEGRLSGMRTEAHAAGEVPVAGNLVGNIMQ